MKSSPRSSPRGCASSSTSRYGQWQVSGTVGVGLPCLSKALTLAPTSQICPVLFHAGMVLLNSLLDTVPGELALQGGELWARPWGWTGGEEEAGDTAVRQHLRGGPFHALLWKGPGFKCGLCHPFAV